MIYYFRSLFPNWNFFDQIGSAFTIEVYKDNHWQLWPSKQSIPWYGFLFNPSLNFKMAEYNIIEHFVSDLAQKEFSADQIITLDSFKLTLNLIKNNFQIAESSELKFKIYSISQTNLKKEIFSYGN